MMKLLVSAVLAVLTVSCGGHKHADTTPGGDPSVMNAGGEEDNHDASGDMIPPEKMEAVTQAFKRKEMIISRCLADAVERQEAKKNTHGKIALEVVIAPSGKASSVKVVKSSIDVQTVQDCVVKHVQDISFPELPKQYETSYTYSMEAN